MTTAIFSNVVRMRDERGKELNVEIAA